MECHIDFETRSAADLKRVGTHVYAMDPSADVTCLAYAFDDEAPRLWIPPSTAPKELIEAQDPRLEPPQDLYDYVERGGKIVAHNAAFEWVIWRCIMERKHGAPRMEAAQLRCTMAQCYAMGLPGSLENAAAALGVEAKKDKRGYDLMLKICMPVGTKPDGSLAWHAKLEDYEGMYAYCIQDVEVERHIDSRVRRLSSREQEVWALDQIINMRGITIDVEAVEALKKTAVKMKRHYDLQMNAATEGEVGTSTSHAALKAYINDHFIRARSTDKAEIDRILDRPDIPDNIREVAQTKRLASKSSVAKLTSMLSCHSHDKRARGLFQYHAATTGRWSSRRVQVHNLPRPEWSQRQVKKILRLLMDGDHMTVDTVYGPPMSAVASCIRACLIAPKGFDLLACDLSAIEARVLAWIAGADHTLAKFRDGVDVYVDQAADIYGSAFTQGDKGQRLVGKVSILSLGYQGGIAAYVSMADGYGISLDPVFPVLWESANEDERRKAIGSMKMWRANHKDEPTSNEAAVAADIIKQRWRASNPESVDFWYSVERAAIHAVAHPGDWVPVNDKVSFRSAGSFLACRLPSGRLMFYPYPEVRWVKTPWDSEQMQLTYMSTKDSTRKWSRTPAYGGSLTENIVQAIARDCLVEGMLRAEDNGYKIVLHVHDEIVTEMRQGEGDVQELERLMSAPIKWAPDLPLAAEGWRGERYRK